MVDITVYGVNAISLPMHSILVSSIGIDMLYHVHLIVFPVYLLIRSAQYIIFTIFQFEWMHAIRLLTFVSNFLTYVIFSIPTRLLYVKTFQKGVEKGIDP